MTQSNMLNSRTKPALMGIEVQQVESDDTVMINIFVHLWRADMLTGVLEVDRNGIIMRAGCCPLHQPGGF